MPRIAVVGTASWGTTLGTVWARNGHQVRLWARTDDEAGRVRAAGPTPDFQPEAHFPDRLTVTSSIDEALDGAVAVVIAVPAQRMRDNIRRLAGRLDASMLVISATKGLEIGSH
ncbi:MAG: 2-dehydropantoate 2-reductase N-terminal domain-containing protein, partial [Dehalococcoidales bacterium]